MDFKYYLPVNLIFGRGRLNEVGREAAKYGKCAMIVAGGSSKKSGALDKVRNILENERVESVVFDRVTPNPLTTTAEEGAAIAKNKGCDLVIGLGGGSVLDCAKAIMERFGGTVPVEMEDLLSLPGVGRKTANCLRSNVLGLPGIVVDTHFSRVINRLFALGTRDPDKVETFVCSNLDPESWNRFSMTVNLHGRNICHASGQECMICPLKGLCSDPEAK